MQLGLSYKLLRYIVLYHAKHQDHRAENDDIGDYKNNVECPCVLPVEVTTDYATDNDEDSAE